MKIKMLAGTALAILVVAGGVDGCATEEKKEAALQAEAKVSRADAEKVAMAKVPNATIKEGELEKEKGKLIWSFDMTTPDSKDITEVNVDAMTGEVVSVEKETPKQEGKEKD